MAGNDIKKDYIKNQNHDFGSFTPKNNNGADFSESGARQKQPEPVSDAKKFASNINPANNVKNSVKADLQSSATGEDPDKLREQYKEKDNSLSPGGIAKHALVKKGSGKLAAMAGKNVAKTMALGKLKAGLSALAKGVKTLGANIIAGAKGLLTSAAAGIAKAGAFVGGMLHTGATVGTVLVVSGTLAATSIPIVGGVGYFTNLATQRTDGCTPAEYQEQIADDANMKGQGRDVAEIAREWCTPNGANRYVYGGWSIGPKDDYDPTNANSGGADCGHFVQLCFWKAGSTVLTQENRCGGCVAIKDINGGKYLIKTGNISESDCEVGDVLINGHHAWIYIGNGEIAHAKGRAYGCVIDPWRNDAQWLVRPYEAQKDSEKSSSKSGSTQQASGQMKENMDRVAKVGRRIWKKYHIWPSVLVAQSICETSCGTNGYTVERNNWFCIAAYDTNLDAAYDFPTVEEGIEAAAKNYWGGASAEYKNVILAKSPEEQMKAICRSGWAKSHYGDPSGSTGGSLKEQWDKYGLSKYDAGLKDFTPDMSAYGGSLDADSVIDASGADENADIADKTADDGCGGEMNGYDSGDSAAFTGQGIVHENGWTYLNFDMDAVSKLGDQLDGSSDCYVYAIGYADLVMRGKWKFSGDATQSKMRSAYGYNGTNNGYPASIGGVEGVGSSTDDALKTIKESITKNHKPVTVCTTAGGGHHFMTVVGWKSSAGSNPKWEDLVVIDSSAPELPEGEDGSYKIKQFHVMKASYNGSYCEGGAVYDGWKK